MTRLAILFVEAVCDGGITFATALGAVMVVNGGPAVMPTRASVIVAALGGAVAGLRTLRNLRKTLPRL